jgi:uroporphyrinogen decarboxylase
MMTQSERIKRCIHFQETDINPWQINYTSELADSIMPKLDLKQKEFSVLEKNIYKYNELDNFFGNHIGYVRNRPVNTPVETEPGMYKDEWGVVWDRLIDRDIGNPVDYPLKNVSLHAMDLPDPDNPDRYLHFQPVIDSQRDRYILAKFSYSLYERAWSVRGMENLLVDFTENPSFVQDLLALICEWNLKVMRNLQNYHIDGIYFGDDWGSQRGLIISPEMWRQFIRPHLKKMYDQAHCQGYDVFIHSCGDIAAILDDLIEIGLNVFNPFQPEVMDIEAVLKKYSGKLAFYGSLSIQKTLPFGDEKDVEKEVNHRLDLAKKHKGLIISPSHDMPPDIPLKNIISMKEKLEAQ